MCRAMCFVSGMLLLSSCQQTNTHGSIEALKSVKVVNVAVDAVNELREAFNSGKCDQIYVEASANFRRAESPESWRATCEKTRANLGSWVNFQLSSTKSWPLIAHVDGTAIFSRAPYRLITAWNFERGRPRLFRLYLEGTVTIPRPAPPPGIHRVEPPIPRRPLINA